MVSLNSIRNKIPGLGYNPARSVSGNGVSRQESKRSDRLNHMYAEAESRLIELERSTGVIRDGFNAAETSLRLTAHQLVAYRKFAGNVLDAYGSAVEVASDAVKGWRNERDYTMRRVKQLKNISDSALRNP